MSVEALSWALNAQLENAVVKLVLVGLGNHASAEFDEARPSVPTLARYACCSERSVQRHLRKLEGDGWIEKTGEHPISGRKDRAVSVYRLVRERGDNLSPRSDERGDKTGLRGDTALSPEPSLEPSLSTANAVESSKERASASDQPSLDAEFEQRVEKFLDVHAARVEAKGVARPTKTAAARTAARAILRREPDARAILARLDWALAHPYWSTRARTVAKFRTAWDDLTLQWKASIEQQRGREQRERQLPGRPQESRFQSVSYDSDRVEITR